MVSLVLKDVIIQKKIFLFSALYGTFILLIFSAGGAGMAAGAYIMGIVATTYLFIQTGMAMDDKNNTEIIFNSLPISRNEIVLAKYISSVMSSMVNLFIMGAIGFLLSNFVLERVRLITYSDIIVGLASVWLLIVLYLPFYFRFGYIKSKVFNMFFFFLFFFGPGILMSLILESPDHDAAKVVIKLVTEHPTALLGGIVLVMIGILLLVSMIFSFKFYANREL